VDQCVGRAADGIPDRHRDDDEALAAFRDFLRREVGEDAVRLLDRRFDGVSLRQLASDARFGVSGWALRRLVQRVREAALAFARKQADDGFVRAVERLLPDRQEHVDEASGWWILAGQAV
jgi:hypothetical protein